MGRRKGIGFNDVAMQIQKQRHRTMLPDCGGGGWVKLKGTVWGRNFMRPLRSHRAKFKRWRRYVVKNDEKTQ